MSMYIDTLLFSEEACPIALASRPCTTATRVSFPWEISSLLPKPFHSFIYSTLRNLKKRVPHLLQHFHIQIYGQVPYDTIGLMESRGPLLRFVIFEMVSSNPSSWFARVSLFTLGMHPCVVTTCLVRFNPTFEFLFVVPAEHNSPISFSWIGRKSPCYAWAHYVRRDFTLAQHHACYHLQGSVQSSIHCPSNLFSSV